MKNIDHRGTMYAQQSSSSLSITLLSALIMLMTACQGDPEGDSLSDGSLSVNEQKKQFVYESLKDSYLWYNQIPAGVDLRNYPTPENLLQELRYKTRDKWSYITSVSGYTQYFEAGTYLGYGFSMRPQNDKIYLGFTYARSPAAAVLKRGQEILAINGKTIREINEQKLWDSIFGADSLGVETTLRVREGGLEKNLTLRKALVKINTVLHSTVLNSQGKKVGYLAFKSFIEPSRAELKTAFETFKDAGVQELVLDLRYNGGGRVQVSQYLASLIAEGGRVKAGDVYERFAHNDKYTHWNRDYYFEKTAYGLGLGRVYVIATDSTCSASEGVINGLRPFIQVHLIGSRTCGKPVGMYSRSYKGLHLSMIEFEGFNAVNQGRYYGGLAPTCSATDDFTHDLGNPAESMLAEALHLLHNGSCRPATRAGDGVVPKPYTAQGKGALPAEPDTELFSGFRRELGAI